MRESHPLHLGDHSTGSLSTTSEALQSDQGQFGNALASTLDDYRQEAPLEHDNLRAHEGLTPIRAQAREQRTKTFAGAGSVKDFRAGTTLTLTQHPVHDQDAPQSWAFVLTSVESAFRALKSELGYSARTTCHPSALHPQPAWRGQSPPPDPHLRQP